MPANIIVVRMFFMCVVLGTFTPTIQQCTMESISTTPQTTELQKLNQLFSYNVNKMYHLTNKSINSSLAMNNMCNCFLYV